MTAAVFVDSNVFLYAMDEGDKSKQEAARNWRSGCGRAAWGG
jgi:predicted nucleic acid-binding protein